MFKKVLYLGSFCLMAALASCGNSQKNEEALPEGDSVVVGEVVTEVVQNGDSIAAATAEVVDTMTSQAQGVGDAVKDAAVKADKAAN